MCNKVNIVKSGVIDFYNLTLKHFKLSMQNNTVKILFAKTGRILFTAVLTILLFLGMLEVAYRFQWFDFYKKEFEFLNKDVKHVNGLTKVLVLGDSFTAFPGGYVDMLNKADSTRVFYNSGISGIGAQEICCIAPRRLKQIKPSLVLIQVYVGNDLIDIEKPVNYKTISLFRNLYWTLTNKLYGARYINYNLGRVKYALGKTIQPISLKDSSKFAVEKMNKRELLLISADPNYYEKSIFIRSGYEGRFLTFVQQLKKTISRCELEGIKVKVIVIPASFQVSDYYKKNLEKCGAVFTSNNTLEKNYPLVRHLTQELSPTPVLNPINALQHADSSGNRVYFENDLHLSEKGNIVLANFLSGELR